MITPHLEKLIWEGKAFFKTFVAGGSKTTLNIGQDRFIIITDITYFPNQSYTFDYNYVNTQVSIYGEKGFNHYIFRNNGLTLENVFNGAGISQNDGYVALSPITINTYLLHTTQVGFSFIKSGQPAATTVSGASVDNPYFAPPIDYGTNADPATVVPINTDLNFGILNQLTNRLGYALPIGSPVSQQIQFEASGLNVPNPDGNPFFALINVNYVEILGEPNNIGF